MLGQRKALTSEGSRYIDRNLAGSRELGLFSGVGQTFKCPRSSRVGVVKDSQDQRRSLRGVSNRKRNNDSAGTWTSLPRVMICVAAPAPAPEAAPIAAPFPPPAIAPMIAPRTAPPPTYLPVRAFPPRPSLRLCSSSSVVLTRSRRPTTETESTSKVISP